MVAPAPLPAGLGHGWPRADAERRHHHPSAAGRPTDGRANSAPKVHLIDERDPKGAAYQDIFVARELARYGDPYRERWDGTPETTDMLYAWFVLEGSAALRAVVERARTDARRD